MQILRLPPYPISVSYPVPEASENYILVIKDKDVDQDILVLQKTSDYNSNITHTFDGSFVLYDESYSLTVYEDNSIDEDELIYGDIVLEDNLEIIRPYVDPKTLATTASDIAEYTKYERQARSIIDSITGGFYFHTKHLKTVGQGTDYIPLTDRVYKILYAIENAQVVYNPALDISGDWIYVTTNDHSAITKVEPGTHGVNRSERKPPRIPIAQSDSFGIFDTEDSPVSQTFMPGVLFPEGWDYIFLLEVGYKVVPHDIKEATLMLIDDLKCGRIDYHKRYVTSYATDQYRIQVDKSSLLGTGNIIVDKILENYKVSTIRPGVL